jgi:hypothetical protein
MPRLRRWILLAGSLETPLCVRVRPSSNVVQKNRTPMTTKKCSLSYGLVSTNLWDAVLAPPAPANNYSRRPKPRDLKSRVPGW